MKNPEDIEKFLRDQMRAIIPVSITLAQWGVTVLLGFQAALYFIRKETKEALIDQGVLAKNELLPLHRYLIGTLILLIVAIMFHALSNWVGRRYRYYMTELQNLPHKYPDYYKKESDLYPFYPKDSPRVMIRGLFYFFPLVDILIYAYAWLWSVSMTTDRKVVIVAMVAAAVTCLFTAPLGVLLVQWFKAASVIGPDGNQARPKDNASLQ